jgi:hypothetical protein
MAENALRYNEDKLKWHNFPLFLIRPMIMVAHYGASKYATWNFLKGAPITQYMDCMKRHLDAFEDPTQDDLDAESKINHLAHVAWNALVAVWVLENKPELDDRFKMAEKNQPYMPNSPSLLVGNEFVVPKKPQKL